MTTAAVPPRPGSATTPTPPTPAGAPRWVWLIMILLAAMLIAGTAGLLSHAAGNSIPAAILTAGAAFAGTFALLLGVAHFLGGE